MKRYARPGLCFDCGMELRGEEHCPRCGLPVVGPEASRLARLLHEADRVMARLDASRAQQPVATASGGAAAQAAPQARYGTPPAPPGTPPSLPPLPPAPPPMREPRPRVSAGAVLLALGAGCLVIAAVVFIAVTWGSLSLAARTLVLLGLTAVAFAATAWATRRRLTASVEALSVVAWFFLGIDLLAGRSSELLGLDRLSEPGFVAVAGLLAALPGSLVVGATRRSTGREPVVTSLVALGGWVAAFAALADAWDAGDTWLLVVVVVLAGGLSAAYAYARLQLLAVGLLVLAAALYAALWLAVAGTALLSDHSELVRSGDVWPALIAVALPVAGAATLLWVPAARRHGELLLSAVSVAVTLLIALLLVAPAWQAGTEAGVVVLCAVALLLTVVGRTTAAACIGPRALSPFALLACAVVALPWLYVTADAFHPLLLRGWRRPVDAGLRSFDVGGLLPLWTAVVCLVTVALGLLVLSRWQGLVPVRRVVAVLAAALLWAAVGLVAVVTSELLVVAVLVLAVPGLALVGVGARTRRPGAQAAGALALLGACGLALPSVVLSLCVWAGVLVVLAAALVRAPRSVLAAGHAFAGVLLAAGATAAVVHLAGGADRAQSLTLALLVAAGLVAGALAPPLPARSASTVALAVVAAVSLSLAADPGLAWVSLVLTVMGAAASAVGVLESTLTPLAPVGAAALLVAWWLRLVASEIDVVEAYTALPAAALLAAGLWAVLRRGTPTLQALLPGLTLALAPSVPWAVLDPTSTRGLLLSAAGLALLAAGVSLRWMAPFLAGAAVVALMAVAHLAPYASEAPRWVVLAAVGLVLLVVGITWEARVRDLRSMAVYVSSMR